MRRTGRVGVPLAVVVLLLGLITVLAVRHERSTSTNVRLSSGASWMASPDGTVALIDGFSGKREAYRRVANPVPAGSLRVAQGDSAGFVANTHDGTVVRIDAGTFVTSDAVRFSKAGDPGLKVFPVGEVTFVVSGARQTVTTVESSTLHVLSSPETFHGDPTNTIVTDDGTLWTVDPEAGLLARYRAGRRAGAERITDGGHPVRLLEAKGEAVVADLVRNEAVLLDRRTGAPRSRACLDLPRNDRVQVGSADDGLEVAAVSDAGNVVVIADLEQEECTPPIAIDRAGRTDTYGAPVLRDGKAYIPDLTTGEVVIVDPSAPPSGRVRAIDTKLGGGHQLRLFNRDGLVWFDDESSEHAGAILGNLTVVGSIKTDPAEPVSNEIPVQTEPQKAPPPTDDTSAPNPTDSVGPVATTTPRTTGTKTTPGTNSTPGTASDAGFALPDVRGQARAAAEASLKGLKLATSVEQRSSTQATGTVLDTSPQAGQTVHAGDVVKLIVSAGDRVVVPEVAGMSEAAATNALTTLGLNVTVASSTDPNVPDGQAIRTDPAEGTEVSTGSKITLTVSSGNGKIKVPAIAGLSESEANAALQPGLMPNASHEYRSSTGVVAGSISPSEGSEVDPGTTVSFIVADPIPGVSASCSETNSEVTCTTLDGLSSLSGITYSWSASWPSVLVPPVCDTAGNCVPNPTCPDQSAVTDTGTQRVFIFPERMGSASVEVTVTFADGTTRSASPGAVGGDPTC